MDGVRHLNLSDMNLGPEELAAIAEACSATKAGITTLLVNNNDIGDSGMRVIAESPSFSSLQRLLARSNGIGMTGVLAFASARAGWCALRELVLSGNPLRDAGVVELCRHDGALPNLRALEVDDCGLTDSAFLHLLASMNRAPWDESVEHLWIANNQFSEVPTDLIRYAQAEQWREYAHFLYDPGVAVDGAKIILLGEGRTGKTHVCKRVFESKFAYFDPEEARTQHFVAVESSSYMPLKFQERTLHVRVWDFGGQRHMHGAHRMFVSSSRTAFILVCDALRSREENRVDYWLRFVKHEASPVSPIVVVVTKCDLFRQHADVQHERQLEPMSASTLAQEHGLPAQAIAVVDGLGWASTEDEASLESPTWVGHATAIERLDRAVRDAISSSAGLVQLFPESFGPLMTWLRTEAFGRPDELPRPYVSRRVFEDLCVKLRIDGRDGNEAIAVAHDAGLLHFVGRRLALRRGSQLAERLFNVEWLCGPVYRLICSRDECRLRGLMFWSEIESLLPVHGGRDGATALWERIPLTAQDRLTVLDVMRASNLLFPVRRVGAEEVFLIPDHLDRRNLASPPEGICWRREFEWLPEGVFTSLMSRLFLKPPHDPAALWRDEITIRREDGAAVVVRLVDHTVALNDDTHGQFCSTVFVGVTGCAEREAERMLSIIDVELRGVLGEPLVGSNEWHRVEPSAVGRSKRPENRREPAPAEGVVLTIYAEMLLKTLQECRKSTVRMPDDAWLSKSDWFRQAGFESKRRKEAAPLIDELLAAGLIEFRDRGAKGLLRQYRAVDTTNDHATRAT